MSDASIGASLIGSTVGAGSFDVNALVTGLVEAKGAPTEARLDKAETKVDAEISAFGTLKSSLDLFKSAMSQLNSEENMSKRNVYSGDTDVFSATVTSDAVATNYNVDITSLASAHSLIYGFAQSDSTVDEGTLGIEIDGTENQITIDASNNTLSGVMDAVNDADIGVRASIIDTGVDGSNRYKLVFTSEETGTASSMTITGVSQLINASKESESVATNAVLSIDGVANITRSTNIVDDVLEGVTLTLGSEGSSSLSVAKDTAFVRQNVEDFVAAYNEMQDMFDDFGNYDITTGESAALAGDSALRSIENDMRSMVTSESYEDLDGEYKTLSAIGVSLDRYGKLEVDDDKLSEALNLNFDDVSTLFIGSGEDIKGVAGKMEDLMDDFLDNDGIIENRLDGLNDRVEDISEDRTDLAEVLEKAEDKWRQQFAALDALMGSMEQTRSFLENTFNSMNGND